MDGHSREPGQVGSATEIAVVQGHRKLNISVPYNMGKNNRQNSLNTVNCDEQSGGWISKHKKTAAPVTVIAGNNSKEEKETHEEQTELSLYGSDLEKSGILSKCDKTNAQDGNTNEKSACDTDGSQSGTSASIAKSETGSETGASESTRSLSKKEILDNISDTTATDKSERSDNSDNTINSEDNEKKDGSNSSVGDVGSGQNDDSPSSDSTHGPCGDCGHSTGSQSDNAS